MGKKLSEMTLEELWELFPITLVDHKEYWQDYYSEMKEFLSNELSKCQISRMSHIGSTAIDNIWAKNIFAMKVIMMSYILGII